MIDRGCATTALHGAPRGCGGGRAAGNRGACHRATLALAFSLAACSAPASAPPAGSDHVAVGVSLLSADERRERAGRIRDAALARGMTQGWLLAGIADAETSMSHCWAELTWACQGPASPDCGGGPVVAGAGDGPCELQQGGLGMFQFDAGTYADTLAREGERVLYIDGNVQAAVDFVVSMLIRSVHVDGIDDAAQAIAWSNGVRRDNERWDPWIRTVTHYYNGCTPNASCWSQRYAHYLDNTNAVYDEMGDDFWSVSHEFAAEYVHQTFPLAADPFELPPGEQVSGHIEMRNSGRATWMPGQTLLGTTEPRDAPSPLAGPDWIAPHRPATVDRPVAPGESGRFAFTLQAPAEPGDHPQFFNLVQENVAWFGDQGGPPDEQLQVRVTVVPGSPCAAGVASGCDAGRAMEEDCDGGACPPPAGGGDPSGRGLRDAGDSGARADDAGSGQASDAARADAGEHGSRGDGGCRAAPGEPRMVGALLPPVLALLGMRRRARIRRPAGAVPA